MSPNKPLIPAEQESPTKEVQQSLERINQPVPEFHETAGETLETGGIKKTEAQPGEEKATEPSVVPVKYAKIIPPPEPKPEQLRQIENILSDDLKNAFLELSPEKQLEFKREGERVAGTIFQMIYSAKIQVKKIVDLIAGWLKRLPGVNKYFIEQESKIKADKIINLTKQDGA